MPRVTRLLPLVFQVAFTRLAAAQDSLADTLSDSLRRPAHLDGAWLRRLPIDDPRHALVLIPGVRLSSADIGITPAPSLLIRGDPAGRGNVYVDGALLRFETRGGAGVALAPNAIDTVSLMTGVAPATLSDAGGGVIAYQTRSGGPRLAGGVRWDSDEPFSDAATVGYNRLEGTFGGPLAASGKLTFFVATTLQGQQSSYRDLNASKIPAFLPAGVDTIVDQGGPVTMQLWENDASGLRRPLDWSGARHAHAKLAYRYGASSQASLTIIGGDLQQRLFPGQLALAPQLYRGRRLWSGAAIMNWRHGLGALRGGPVSLAVNLSLVRHRDLSGPLDSTVERATRDPALGIAFRRLRFAGADIVNLPTSESLVRDIRTNSGTRGVPFLGVLPDASQRAWTNPYGVAFGWPTDGFGGTLSDVAERRVQGRWLVDWRRARDQWLGLGADWERAHISSYSSDIVRQLGTDLFMAGPSRLGVFTENRLVTSGAVIDLGLRYDRITPGGELPIVPSFITSSGLPLWNPNAATDDTAYSNSVARVFRRPSTKSVVSPRIRFAYPVGNRVVGRLGYSRTVEPPTWGMFFAYSNNDISFTDAFDLFGRDVDFIVTSLIEAGVRYGRGTTRLDVGLYRKELPRYAGRLTPFRRPSDTTNIVTVNALASLGASHVEGLDVALDWHRGWVQASAAYSFAHLGSIISAHSGAIALSLEVPDDWRRGSTLATIARGANVVLLVRAQNGQTFGVQENNGVGTISPIETFFVSSLDVARLPWLKRLDLRLTKTVRTGGHDWSVYVDARNILNFSNQLAAFAETGDTANPLHKIGVLGDPTLSNGSANYAILWNAATNAGALAPNKTVDLSGCGGWSNPLNCVALTRVERRFGDGDQQFTLTEQERAFDAYYRDFFGAWRLYAPGRTIRVGLELSL